MLNTVLERFKNQKSDIDTFILKEQKKLDTVLKKNTPTKQKLEAQKLTM